jgi:hypothetical protein
MRQVKSRDAVMSNLHSKTRDFGNLNPGINGLLISLVERRVQSPTIRAAGA